MTNTVRVHRNPGCARCARYARMHQRLDWLGRVEDSVQSPFERPMRMGEVVVRDLRDGRLHAGADGIALLARQVPPYWAMLPLMPIPAVLRAIERDDAGTFGATRTLSTAEVSNLALLCQSSLLARLALLLWTCR